MRSQSILLPALLAGLAGLPVQAALGQGNWELELPVDEPDDEEEDDGPGSAADVPESDPDSAPADALPDEQSYRNVYERGASAIDTDKGPKDPRAADPSPGGVQWGVIPDSTPADPEPVRPADPEPVPTADPPAEVAEGSEPEPGAEPTGEGDAADGGTDGGEALAGDEGETEAPNRAIDLIVPEGDSAEVVALWNARRADLKEMDPSQARAREDAIAELAVALDLGNLPGVSAALIREGRNDLEHGRGAEALRKARLALQLSPALPEAEQFLARATLVESPGSVGEILSASLASISKRFSSLPERRALKANGLGLLGLAGLLALLSFFAVTVLGRMRLFLHDFHHRFPRGTSYLQSTAVAVVLIVVPFFLGFGLLPALLLPGIAAWPYLGSPRRIALLATVGAVGFAVPATSWLFSQGRFWETRAADVWMVENTGEWEGALPRLRARVEAKSATYPEVFALARAEKRLGRLEKARGLYEEAAGAGGASDAALHNNLGVVLFALGDYPNAKDALQKAVSIDGGSAAAYHNLAKVYFKRGELAKGQEARKQALALDRDLVEAHPDTEPRMNVALADLPLATAFLAPLLADGANHDPGWQVRTRVAGLLPEVGAWMLALAAMALLFLGGFLRERLGVAGPCNRCGRPVCRKCDREAREGQCGQCVNVFEKQDLVAPEVRIAKEKSILRRRKILDRAEQIGGILVPGLGQIIGQRLGLGLALLFFLFFGLTGILFWNGPVPTALWADGGLPTWRIAGCGILLGITWIVSLWSVIRR